jgi:hypothetical protein
MSSIISFALVYAIPKDGLFEVDWLEGLLGGLVDRTVNASEYAPTPGECPIFVVNRGIDAPARLAQLSRDCDASFGVVHLSDEFLSDDVRYYEWPTCAFVIRNYYKPEVARLPHVLQIGVGYKRGFRPKQRNARPLDWCFMGDTAKSGRAALVSQASKAMPNHFVHVNHGFNGADCMDTASYCERMLLSKFCLSPVGNYNLDTFRLYEALEAGAIPVALARTPDQPWSYWHALFGIPEDVDLPFVARATWDENLREMQALLDDPVALEEKATACARFWAQYKASLKDRVRELVLAAAVS